MEYNVESFKKKINILNSAMEKLVAITKEQCIEQADLMDRLWKGAFEVHDRVHQLTNTVVNELRCEQMDNLLLIRQLKRRIKLSKLGDYSNEPNPIPKKSSFDDSHETVEEKKEEINALKAELRLKDNELLGVHQTLAQLSVWFPQFPRYSQSLLSRMLPPVDDSILSHIDISSITPDKLLLQDLRRLEKIGIGLRVVTRDDIADRKPKEISVEASSVLSVHSHLESPMVAGAFSKTLHAQSKII